MNQREIRIPLRCSTVSRLIGLGFVLLINFLILNSNKLDLRVTDQFNFFIGINAVMLIVWGVIEFSLHVQDCWYKDKPVLPFRFKCKCEDDKK